MNGKCWMVPCAVVLLSGTFACAAAGHATKGAAPAPQAASAPAVPPAPPRNVADARTGAELVFVEGGCFRMGNTRGAGGPEEKPVHEVCVGDFYLGRHEVTQRQWRAVMGSSPASHAACGDDCPVETVSWDDVQQFLARLNGARGVGAEPAGEYRLPTEAEWEYAARSAGKDEKYAGGDDVDAVAWYFGNATASQPVGLKAPNGLGIHDMTGNVWEWTSDWYGDGYYASSPRDNPAGPGAGERRAVRGGSFGNEAFDARTAYRNYLPPDHRGAGVGFRLLRTVPVGRVARSSSEAAVRP